MKINILSYVHHLKECLISFTFIGWCNSCVGRYTIYLILPYTDVRIALHTQCFPSVCGKKHHRRLGRHSNPRPPMQSFALIQSQCTDLSWTIKCIETIIDLSWHNSIMVSGLVQAWTFYYCRFTKIWSLLVLKEMVSIHRCFQHAVFKMPDVLQKINWFQPVQLLKLQSGGLPLQLLICDVTFTCLLAFTDQNDTICLCFCELGLIRSLLPTNVPVKYYTSSTAQYS